ncbi:heparan-alpha-glucosaminide N-acetyltransferase domain-containing protein [Methanocorpusculum sp.]
MRGSRYFELDAARGIALILLIIYHILFCLYFFGTGLVPWFNPYTMSGAPIAFLFIVIAGISLVLSTGRETSPVKAAKKLFLRSLYLLCIAAMITLVTWIVYPEEVVVFGILHLIGVATILSIPFVVLKVKPYVPLVFGIICIVLSPLVSMLRGRLF